MVKPSEETPATALMLAAILREAGLLPGLVNVVTGTGPETGAPLVAHPDVRHVTFTGSGPTGTAVLQGAARNVASVTLELGGKSPVVVLADCDLERALEGVMGGIFKHAGQVCSAGSRFVIERPIRDRFLEALAVRRGPINRPRPARPRLRARRLRTAARQGRGDRGGGAGAGREILVGGRRTVDPRTGLGFFYEPTVVVDLPEDDPMVREEIFGPVLAVQIAEDAGDASRRVADASIFPNVTSGNTNAPSIMVGERGAELILKGV